MAEKQTCVEIQIFHCFLDNTIETKIGKKTLTSISWKIFIPKVETNQVSDI